MRIHDQVDRRNLRPLTLSADGWISRLALPGALVLVPVLLGWLHAGQIVDDGFIFARFARNLLRGDGWSFNPGESVNACTSPLWVLIVAALMTLCSGAKALLIAHVGAVALLGAGLLRILKTVPAWVTALVVIAALSNKIVWRSVGMDATLACALCVWTAWAYARFGASARTGLILGLAVFARPDAALLGAILLTITWWRTRSLGGGLIAGVAVVLAPWTIYALTVFGSPIPGTLAVKTSQSSLGDWAGERMFALAAMDSISLSWVMLALGLVGLVAAPRFRSAEFRAAHLIVVYGLGHAIAYSAIGAPVGYPWYVLPLSLALLVMAGLGVESLAERIRSAPAARAPMRSAPALLALATASILWPRIDDALANPSYRVAPAYRRAAAFVMERFPSDSTLAATEIGYLGFFSDRTIVDMHGLIHPEVIGRIRARESWWWLDRAPTLVATHDPPWYAEPLHATFSPRAKAKFLNEYRLVEIFTRGDDPDGRAWRHGALQLWERRAGNPPKEAG